uniref:Uncharacterized protein n=1 Tax=Kalanchoe fedtschenkoi TaxID=63787 RepID=A0A7N0R9X2_KALFE
MMLDAVQKFQKTFVRYCDIDPFFVGKLSSSKSAYITQDENSIGNQVDVTRVLNRFDWKNIIRLSRFLKNFYNNII